MTDSDCFWFPNLEKCQNKEDPIEVVPEAPDAPTERTEVMTTMDHINPLYGQIAFLTVALFNVAIPAMIQFRWRADPSATESWYALWTTSVAKSGLSTNYWELSNMVRNYGSIALWSVAFITQALSLAGLFADINVLVWTMGVMLFGLLLNITYSVLVLLGIMAAQKFNGTTTNDANEIIAAGNFVTGLANEFAMVVAGQAFSGAIMAMNKDSWWAAQKMNMGEKETDAKTEELLSLFGL